MKVTVEIPNNEVENLLQRSLTNEELTVAKQVREAVKYYNSVIKEVEGKNRVVTIAEGNIRQAQRYNQIKIFEPYYGAVEKGLEDD